MCIYSLILSVLLMRSLIQDVFLNPINETLTGEEAEHGRFGNGMASLGDITADGIDGKYLYITL